MIEWALIVFTSNVAVADRWGSNSLQYHFTTEQQCNTARDRFLAVGRKRREKEMQSRFSNLVVRGPDPINQVTRMLNTGTGDITAECLQRKVVRPKS